MKNIENMNALNDMAMAAVAGGGDLPHIFDPGTPLVMDHKRAASAETSNPYPPLGRPLPFPQDRRGNKAPFGMNANPYAPIQKIQGLPDDPLDTNPFDFPFV